MIPEIIIKLEKKLKTQFKEVDISEIIKDKGITKLAEYSIDQNENVIGLCIPYFNLKKISNILSGKSTLTNSLTHLNLCYNTIHDISALSKYKKISKLNLEDNQILDISELRELTNLIELSLNFNYISDISALKKLKKLTELFLSDNKISDISPLKELKNLTTLKLGVNPIKKLSKWILNFSKMDIQYRPPIFNENNFITFHENPIETPPIEIISQGKEAMKIWFSDNEKLPVNESKVIFVGEGAVGKTSVMKQLMDLQFDTHEPETKGININDLQVKHQETDITLHLWDFGGQEFMHATHQFFLSRRSLYVLVLDGRKEEKKDYWLKVIEAFGGESPVIIVMNKIDTNKHFDLNRKFMREKYPNIKEFFRVSCATGEGIKEFLHGLSRIASEVKMVKTKWLKTWFNIKNKLTEITHDFISYSQFTEICNQLGITDEQEQEREILIEYLDNLGVLLHFREFDLTDTHILNPKWVTDAVYKIINYEKIVRNDGKLKLEWVKDILKKQEDTDFNYPPEKQLFIVSLMKKFELCYELNKDTVLIPDLLDIKEPEFELDKATALKIIIRYEEFLPKSILPRLMVKMYNDIHVAWRTGVIFKNITNNARLIFKTDDDKKIIYIYVDGEFRRDYYSVLRNNLYEINNYYKSGFTEFIPCDCNSCITNAQPTLYEYKKIKSFQKHGRSTVICDNYPYHEIKIIDLIDDLLNHKPIDLHNELLDNLLESVKRIQQNYKQGNENYYNDLLAFSLEDKKYVVKREKRIGTSQSDNGIGYLDLAIYKNGKILALAEAFKLKSFAKTGREYTANHLLKLLENYNPNGLKHCFAVCYVEMKDFNKIWTEYKSNVKDFVFHYAVPKFEMQDITEDYLRDITDIKLGLTEHSREGQLIKLYHIFINMKFQNE